MNIKEKFLELTKRTYPNGTEDELFIILNKDLNNKLNKDEFGNFFIKIGDNDVMFTSHLDTVTYNIENVTHVIEKNIIKTNGDSILGADDKAGVTILLYMIEHNIPGLYYFFVGEEVGCIGSKKLADKFKSEKSNNIRKVISFDRRGTTSVITFQSSKRCCSEKFAEELSNQLNLADSSFSYKNDSTGIYTDSAKFIDICSECTNISVGYTSEHTHNESQDIEHLEKLAKACLYVKWDELPVERDYTKTEYKSYSGYRCYGIDEYDDWGTYTGTSRYPNWDKYEGFHPSFIENKDQTKKIYYHDNKYNYVSIIEIDEKTKKIKSVSLSVERVNYEMILIGDLLDALDIDYYDYYWDGFKLTVVYDDNNSNDCDRNDLLEYLPELDYLTNADFQKEKWSDTYQEYTKNYDDLYE